MPTLGPLRRHAASPLAAVLALACVAPAPPGKPADSATQVDSGPTDSGPTDSGPTDSGPTDSGPTDPGDCRPDHTALVHTPTVLTATEAAEYRFESWQIDAWLFLNGLGWLTPTSYGVHTWRIRYTTQDRGAEVEATAIVAVPALGAESARGTILWTHPTSGYEDMCAPSMGSADGLATTLVMAARGYVVVAPDYLGLMGGGDPAPHPHPWIVGEPTAIASLDALRAADDWLPVSGELARVDRSRIVYWGWSEGGFAALQADRWAPTWAPDHTPVGVVSAVPPVNLVGQVTAGASAWSPATVASALMLHLAGDWYGEDTTTALLPEVAGALPAEVAASCTSWPSVDQAGSPEAVFQPDLLAALAGGLDHDPWTCLLERSSLPNPEVPYTGAAPVLLVTAADDTLVPTPPTLDAIPGMCAEGYTLQHIDCAGADHGDAPLLTLQTQVGWIDARMRGEPVDAGCGVSAPVSCGG